MNKYQRFALNYYLAWYSPSNDFDEVLDWALNYHDELIMVNPLFNNMTHEQIVNQIESLSLELKRVFS